MALETLLAAAVGAGWAWMASSTGGGQIVMGVVGNFATDIVKRLGGGAYARILAGQLTLPQNHDAARAIRRAQLDATDGLLDHFRGGSWRSSDRKISAPMHNFVDGAKGFLAEQHKAVSTMQLAASEPTVAKLTAAIDSALAGVSSEETAARALALRHMAERITLAELLDGAQRCANEAIETIPQIFEGGFLGRHQSLAGWFDRFIMNVGKALKDDASFKSIYAATHFALLSELLRASGKTQDRSLDLQQIVAAHVESLIASSDEVAERLRKLSSDILDVYDVVRELNERLTADRGAIPLYLPADFTPTGFLRFSYKNLHIPFRGRTAELAALKAFLDSSDRFTWWIAVGGGGAGKSRLALELCLQQRTAWQAGFLPRPHDSEVPGIALLGAWQPLRPTLIVVDYVLARPGQTRDLILGLARREGKLQHPVRVLLLERAVDKRLEQSFYGTSSDKGEMLARRHTAEPMNIPPLSNDELWRLVQDFARMTLGVDGTLPILREEFFARLDRVDRNRRALSAMILAEALTMGGGRQGFAGLVEELEDLLARDREHHWPRVKGSTECAIRDQVEAPFLALATMVNGLQPSHKAFLPQKARKLMLDCNFDACAQVVGCALEPANPKLMRIEPDLLGEFFVLSTLAPKNPFAEEPNHAWLPETAWRIDDGQAMADFVGRAGQNFPAHPSLSALEIVVPGVTASRKARGIRMIAGHKGDEQSAIAAVVNDLAAAFPEDAAARVVMAEFIDSWTLLPATNFSLSLYLYQLVATFHLLAKKYPDESALRKYAAGSIANLIMLGHIWPPSTIIEMLDDLAEISRRHPQEFILRVHLSRGIAGLLKSMYMHARLINAQDISKAQDMLDKLSSLMQCYPQEEKLREYWSWGVQSYFMGVGRDFFHMQKMLEDFGQVTKAYPHERKIVTRWVYCVVEFLSRSPSVDFEKWHVLIENLIGLTNRHPDDVSIRKKTQEAIKHFTNRAV